MTRPSVLMLETIAPSAMTRLQQAVDVVEGWGLDPDQVIKLAQATPVVAIMTRGKGLVTEALMDACPELVAVARCGVGLDNVDCHAATARGIAVLNLPGCNAQTIAEHAIMLMLALRRSLVPSVLAVRDGNWGSRASYEGDEVRGAVLGVIGLGNIGARVARVADALGMTVIYNDVVARDVAYERVERAALFGRADIITLHCQLDDTTRGLIDADALASMQPHAILINTARGQLVDHDALVRCLRSGQLGGYGADVLDVEPPEPGNALLGLPHALVTPHVGSLTARTYREICERSVDNVLAVLADVEPEAGCIFNAAALASR